MVQIKIHTPNAVETVSCGNWIIAGLTNKKAINKPELTNEIWLYKNSFVPLLPR